jgi:hypothetical protein
VFRGGLDGLTLIVALEVPDRVRVSRHPEQPPERLADL